MTLSHAPAQIHQLKAQTFHVLQGFCDILATNRKPKCWKYCIEVMIELRNVQGIESIVNIIDHLRNRSSPAKSPDSDGRRPRILAMVKTQLLTSTPLLKDEIIGISISMLFKKEK